MRNVLTIGVHGKKGHGKDTLGGFVLAQAKALGYNVVRSSLADPLKEEAAKAIAIYESHANEPEKYSGFGSSFESADRIAKDLDENSNVWEPVILWFQGVYDTSVEESVSALKRMLAAALDDFVQVEGSNRYDQDTYDTALTEFHNDKHKHLWRVLLQWWGTEFRRRLSGESYWTDKVKAFNASLPEKTIHGMFDVRFPNEFNLLRNEIEAGFLIKIRNSRVPQDGDGHPSETALDHLGMEQWNCVCENEGTLEDLEEHASMILTNALMWAKMV